MLPTNTLETSHVSTGDRVDVSVTIPMLLSMVPYHSLRKCQRTDPWLLRWSASRCETRGAYALLHCYFFEYGMTLSIQTGPAVPPRCPEGHCSSRELGGREARQISTESSAMAELSSLHTIIGLSSGKR